MVMAFGTGRYLRLLTETLGREGSNTEDKPLNQTTMEIKRWKRNSLKGRRNKMALDHRNEGNPGCGVCHFSLAFLEERIFVDREIESKHKENELQSMYVLRSLSLSFF